MTERRISPRGWILTAAAMLLLAGHGLVAYFVSSHLALSAAVASSVLVLALLKHVGLLGSLLDRVQRRAGRPGRSTPPEP